MKRLLGLIAAFAIGFMAAEDALASMQCGIAPIAPVGCTMVCVCDDDGCRWVAWCG